MTMPVNKYRNAIEILQRGRDVLVDAGRMVTDRGCWPVLQAADRVLLAVRPSVRSVHAGWSLQRSPAR
jgi:hypothetical protein